MPNSFTNITNVTPPRVPLTDARTGLISREWYRFFLNMFQLVGQGQNQISLLDVQYGPPAGTANPSDTGNPSIALDPLPGELLSTTAEMQKQIYGLEMGRQPQLGTMAELQQANVPWLTFDTSPNGTPPDVGTVAWDDSTTLGVQATANVLIRVGEAEYVYAKASSAITKGQLCYHTGSVGASGVITVAPTPLALADPNQIVGVAAETIALNGFGLIQVSGTLRGFNTTGSAVGETWADGDALYYNPAYVGSMTKVKPSAPNQKTYIGEVINAATASSGSMSIRITPGSTLGGTDSNVQFGTLANNDLIQYDSALGYWKNVPASTLSVGTATNLAGGAAGRVPYQTAPGTTTFLPIGAALQVLKVNAGATAPEWVSGAALTRTNDTNVTLTLGGTPTTSLLAATSLTLGWTGQLAVSRGGTGVNTTPTNGELLIGNGTGYTVANLTAGTGVSISNSAGGISISATGTGGTAPVTYTANFSVAVTDIWIINNKSGSSCTATLPAASSYSGRALRFQNYQAQTLVSASSNVVQIGGGAATTSILLASAGDQCTLVSDGTDWIMMQYVPNNILLLE